MIFFFCLGACVGSFLNVVVYRMPREESLISPGSHCPACDHPLAWYLNVPILAWFYLGGKCRYCKAPFSFRYPLVEFVTATLFAGLYSAWFLLDRREAMPPFLDGGWLILIGHLFLVAALLAGSLIDLEHFIIPLSLCYVVVIVGLIIAPFAPSVITVPAEDAWRIIPYVGPQTGALALGGLAGLAVALILLRLGIIKRSFCELEELYRQYEAEGKEPPEDIEKNVNIRREMGREILYLAPIVLGAALVWTAIGSPSLAQRWTQCLAEHKWAAGLLGCVWGYLIGGATVWATRVLGSLLFNKEAMGLGDVHLMGAVGAILGWPSAVVAFFLAPFVGLGYGLMRLLLKGQREIPYGPFLSLATLIVMLWHDKLIGWFAGLFAPVIPT